MFGLDGGDDLAHRTGARRSDLGQHGVGHARRGDRVGIVELLVEIGRQIALHHREPPAMTEAQRVDTGRPVERRGDRCPPIDDDGIVGLVFDVPPADVPAIAVLVGDPPEEVAGTRAVQVFQRFGHRDLDVFRGDLVGGRRRVDGAEPLDHRITAPTGKGQMVALVGEVGEQVSIHGVANASGRATLRSMENEDIVEPSPDDAGIEEELLIEEISIDGMCGVY